jgi:hypothetical protein
MRTIVGDKEHPIWSSPRLTSGPGSGLRLS